MRLPSLSLAGILIAHLVTGAWDAWGDAMGLSSMAGRLEWNGEVSQALGQWLQALTLAVVALRVLPGRRTRLHLVVREPAQQAFDVVTAPAEPGKLPGDEASPSIAARTA